MVTYEADYLNSVTHGLTLGFSHLEIEVKSPEGAPLPVTETGYRSHFLSPGLVEEAGGPIAYVGVWLEEEAKSAAWLRAEARWRQLDLFS